MPKYSAPCAESCLCKLDKTGPVRTIHADLVYFKAGGSVTEHLQITLPQSARLDNWHSVFKCLAGQRIKTQQVLFGTVKFRLDGEFKPLSKIEGLQDRWFKLTGLGRQITGSCHVDNFVDLIEKPATTSRK